MSSTMADRKYDFVIFGATGFTGQFVAAEVAIIAEKENVSWAVAGRNVEKLRQVLKNVEEQTGKVTEFVGIIQADVGDPKSLAEMARSAQVILNCVGPYRFYGEALVKACVENGSHHVDISGEPQFLERMQLDFNSAAKESNVYVVGACGFDSIPADMGTVFLETEFQGQVNTVETYLEIQAPKGCHGHYATWQSAIHGFACAKELKPLRKKLFPQRLPEMKPKIKNKTFHYSPIVESWCLPFPGSDRSVVLRSQRCMLEMEKKRPVQIAAYFQCSSLLSALFMIFGAGMFAIMASFSLGRKLLEKFPRLFSFGVFNHEGPSREEMDNTSFSLTLAGCGWRDKLAEPTDRHSEAPNKRLVVRVSGPEPGYVATPIFMVQAGLVILRETEKLPTGGGVYPPGAAFARTSLIERLRARGIHFEVTEKS